MTQQPLILYDIPSSSPDKAWSPNPWKARLALNAKGIPYRTVWVEYPHIAALCKRIGAEHTQMRRNGPYYTLPVMEDPNTGAIVSDSFKIVQYLDKTYPDTVRLVPDGTAAFQAMFIDATSEKVTLPMLKTLIEKIVGLLNPPSSEYFRRTREAAFGVKIEEIAPSGPARDKVWKEMLEGLSLISKWEAEGKGSFVMGETPSFADLALLALLHWVKVVEGVESKEWKDVMGADGGRWARLYEALEKWIWVDEALPDSPSPLSIAVAPRPLWASGRECQCQRVDMDDPDAAHLAAQAWGAQMVNRSSLASLVFLIWDIIITLDVEVRCIWARPNKYWIKWLFLFVRYFPVCVQIATLFVGTELAADLHYTPAACVAWYIFQEVSTQVLVVCVELILMIRVHALYDRSKRVTAVLAILFLAENIGMVYSLVRVVPGVQFDEVCIVQHTPASIVYFAVSYIAFEAILFGFTLVKFIQAVRTGWGHTPVISLLVRDGTWAFALVFVTVCINGVFYLGLDSSISAVGYEWILSMESFAGCHLILNLQNLERPSTHAHSHNSSSSVIEFTTGLYARAPDRFSRFLDLTLGTTSASASTGVEAYEMTASGEGGSGSGRTDTDASTSAGKVAAPALDVIRTGCATSLSWSQLLDTWTPARTRYGFLIARAMTLYDTDTWGSTLGVAWERQRTSVWEALSGAASRWTCFSICSVCSAVGTFAAEEPRIEVRCSYVTGYSSQPVIKYCTVIDTIAGRPRASSIYNWPGTLLEQHMYVNPPRCIFYCCEGVMGPVDGVVVYKPGAGDERADLTDARETRVPFILSTPSRYSATTNSMAAATTTTATTPKKVGYVRLGSSGLKVSRLILGCMSYGSPEWQPWVLGEEEGSSRSSLRASRSFCSLTIASLSRAEAVCWLLVRRYDAGIQTFDTANVYSNGLSEVILGKAIKQHNLPRDEIVVMTKVRGTVASAPGPCASTRRPRRSRMGM
ncbi:hypothetical protein EVG20_g5710 [Dentipellis fragilis]|uniref:GST N-terminal domain-containing protein n=1 Tax=Dentipellis fragilis TaxID=205917 RepID=A0A4Y9YRB4_9AGAM|nr:hypothetical protein EVG20_g5710 [Dentipellis fragilis]